jgi:hypothetical protein
MSEREEAADYLRDLAVAYADKFRGVLENIAYAGGEEPVTVEQLQALAQEALAE